MEPSPRPADSEPITSVIVAAIVSLAATLSALYWDKPLWALLFALPGIWCATAFERPDTKRLRRSAYFICFALGAGVFHVGVIQPMQAEWAADAAAAVRLQRLEGKMGTLGANVLWYPRTRSYEEYGDSAWFKKAATAVPSRVFVVGSIEAYEELQDSAVLFVETFSDYVFKVTVSGPCETLKAVRRGQDYRPVAIVFDRTAIWKRFKLYGLSPELLIEGRCVRAEFTDDRVLKMFERKGE